MYLCVHAICNQSLNQRKQKMLALMQQNQILKKERKLQNLRKKDEISCTNIDHTIDDMVGVIKNGSTKFCQELEQPTENDVSTRSDIFDQLELDENYCEHRNQTQITCTVPPLQAN